MGTDFRVQSARAITGIASDEMSRGAPCCNYPLASADKICKSSSGAYVRRRVQDTHSDVQVTLT